MLKNIKKSRSENYRNGIFFEKNLSLYELSLTKTPLEGDSQIPLAPQPIRCGPQEVKKTNKKIVNTSIFI